MACTLTIWTDFEVPCTRRFAAAADAFDCGDNALLHLGCSRYVLRPDNGASALYRQREYRDGAYRLSPIVAKRDACFG